MAGFLKVDICIDVETCSRIPKFTKNNKVSGKKKGTIEFLYSSALFPFL